MSGRSLSSGGVPRNPTFGTVIATSALKLNSGATFDLYNTADQTTNYERLRADWSGNVARIYTASGGTGSSRILQLGSGGLATFLQLSSFSIPYISLIPPSTASSAGAMVSLIASWSGTAASGTQTAVSIAPTFNQSGTAGYIALDINPTETATGSGTKLLQRWAVGGTAQAQINNAGATWAQSFNSVNGFGFTTSIGGSTDVVLARDAADTLALRRNTNAQTFRVYNTYTDASNYERVTQRWSGSVFAILSEAAGTGTVRAFVLGTEGSAAITLRTGATDRWNFSSAGHFLANADNSYDIGASGANRPRNVYAAGLILGANLAASGSGGRVYTGVSTVAGLPAAASNPYAHTFVNDSTVAAAGNFGAIVAGGGANIVPVYSDGTNWRIG